MNDGTYGYVIVNTAVWPKGYARITLSTFAMQRVETRTDPMQHTPQHPCNGAR